MKASEWLRAVNAACEKYFPDKPLQQEVLRETRVKVRVEIGPTMFADFFFREETGRTDYTLIAGGQRQYGLDNLGGWHEHPLGSPGAHVPIDPPSPEEAIRLLCAAVDRIFDT